MTTIIGEMSHTKGKSMENKIFGKTYIVKVLDDGECITDGELIRCKDCKRYIECMNECSLLRISCDLASYCCWAERTEYEID